MPVLHIGFLFANPHIRRYYSLHVRLPIVCPPWIKLIKNELAPISSSHQLFLFIRQLDIFKYLHAITLSAFILALK